LHDPVFNHFATIPASAGQVDTQRQLYHASIATYGNKMTKLAHDTFAMMHQIHHTCMSGYK